MHLIIDGNQNLPKMNSNMMRVQDFGFLRFYTLYCEVFIFSYCYHKNSFPSCTYIYSVLSCIINSSFVISNTSINPNVKWKWNRTLKETLKINYHHRAHMVIIETTYRGLMKMPADYEPCTCLRIILNFYIKV